MPHLVVGGHIYPVVSETACALLVGRAPNASPPVFPWKQLANAIETLQVFYATGKLLHCSFILTDRMSVWSELASQDLSYGSKETHIQEWPKGWGYFFFFLSLIFILVSTYKLARSQFSLSTSVNPISISYFETTY